MRRIGTGLLLVLLAGYIVLYLRVRVHEHLVRSRSEALYAAFLTLQPGQTGKPQIEALRTRWAGALPQNVECKQDDCTYRMGDLWRRSRWLTATRLVHDHQPASELLLKTKGDLLSSASFSVSILVPKGYGTREERQQTSVSGYLPYSSGEYMLIGRASLVTELPESPVVSPHPDYRIGGPDGCTMCVAIWVSALPRLPQAKRAQVFGFSFDCMTRWSVCTDKEDIMPQAAREITLQRDSRTAQ